MTHKEIVEALVSVYEKPRTAEYELPGKILIEVACSLGLYNEYMRAHEEWRRQKNAEN